MPVNSLDRQYANGSIQIVKSSKVLGVRYRKLPRKVVHGAGNVANRYAVNKKTKTKTKTRMRKQSLGLNRDI